MKTKKQISNRAHAIFPRYKTDSLSQTFPSFFNRRSRCQVFLSVKSMVSQPVGHGRIFDESRPDVIETEYVFANVGSSRTTNVIIRSFVIS